MGIQLLAPYLEKKIEKKQNLHNTLSYHTHTHTHINSQAVKVNRDENKYNRC